MSDDLTPYEVGPAERFPGVPFENRIPRGSAARTGSEIDDLAAFIAARLDEDEAAAKAAWGIEWDWRYVAQPFGERPSIAHTVHIARHDPARVLSEVAGKRKILAEHKAVTRLAALTGQELGFLGWYREWVLKNLAAAWSDHADYRQEWKP